MKTTGNICKSCMTKMEKNINFSQDSYLPNTHTQTECDKNYLYKMLNLKPSN